MFKVFANELEMTKYILEHERNLLGAIAFDHARGEALKPGHATDGCLFCTVLRRSQRADAINREAISGALTV